MPGAGRYRHVLTLQRRREGEQSSLGGQRAVFDTYATVRGRLTELRGRALESANIVDTRVSTVVVMPFRTDVRADDRLLFMGGVYNVITAVDMDGRRRVLEVRCERDRAQNG